jgi:ABC-type transport system involved in multi-copper enzyme maturation permease subunit
VFIGPVFARELVTTPRRPQHYLTRAVYVTALLVLMCTAWLVVAGTQIIRNVGDMARFGASLFQVLAPLQLALITFLAALGSASAVALEKDRRTLILLLLTRLRNSELVLGKLFASLLDVVTMIVVAIPLFLLVTLFGGVDPAQVWRSAAITLATAVAAASLGSTLALWREKTFQTLALTFLGIVLWVALGEIVASGRLFERAAGLSCGTWAVALSPWRAILAAARPLVGTAATAEATNHGLGILLYLATTATSALILNAIAIARVRVWNPSRELMPIVPVEAEDAGEGTGVDASGNLGKGVGVAMASDASSSDGDEAARQTHVDSRRKRSHGNSRVVWNNPVLWREIRTWAYGRKVLVIRLVYGLLFLLAAAGLQQTIDSGAATRRGEELAAIIPPAARPLAPFLLLSAVIVTALAVTSITSERDGQTLDLLLVTDLTPKEFVLGKIGGILYVTWPMSLLPLGLCGYLWWNGGLSLEDLLFLAGGLATVILFVVMLGIHCGMIYANSRTAIGVSLGTVFFLFLGIITCMVMMISFSGSFQTQQAQFFMVILGGSLGLYVALGSRNPSAAITMASMALPISTFYSITSFSLHHYLAVFFVTVAAYGFTTAAMMVPAINGFDIAMGRKTKSEE